MAALLEKAVELYGLKALGKPLFPEQVAELQGEDLLTTREEVLDPDLD